MFKREQLDKALSTSVLTNTRFQPSAVSFLRDRNNHSIYTKCRAKDWGCCAGSFPALFSACPCLLSNAAPLQICSQPHSPPLLLAVIPDTWVRVSQPGLGYWSGLQQTHHVSLGNQNRCPRNLLERGGPGVSNSSCAFHGGWQLCLVISTD